MTVLAGGSVIAVAIAPASLLDGSMELPCVSCSRPSKISGTSHLSCPMRDVCALGHEVRVATSTDEGAVAVLKKAGLAHAPFDRPAPDRLQAVMKRVDELKGEEAIAFGFSRRFCRRRRACCNAETATDHPGASSGSRHPRICRVCLADCRGGGGRSAGGRRGVLQRIRVLDRRTGRRSGRPAPHSGWPEARQWACPAQPARLHVVSAVIRPRSAIARPACVFPRRAGYSASARR